MPRAQVDSSVLAASPRWPLRRSLAVAREISAVIPCIDVWSIVACIIALFALSALSTLSALSALSTLSAPLPSPSGLKTERSISAFHRRPS
eukprot:4144435-Prymnesium_polylepis.1